MRIFETNTKCIFFIFAIMILSSCKLEKRKIVSTFKDGKPEIVHVYPDSKDTMDYWYLHYYKNGKLFVKGFVKNNKWEGHWQWWYENGSNRDSALLKNGKYVDIRKHWFPNGKVKNIEYLDSIGQCETECCSGHYLHFDTLGRITKDLTFKQGKYNGPQIMYYYDKDSNAMVKEYLEYQNGVQNGRRIEWYANKKRTEGQYVNGKEDGAWHFYKNNKLVTTDQYKNGKVIESKTITAN